ALDRSGPACRPDRRPTPPAAARRARDHSARRGVGGFDVEAPGPSGLDQGPADGGDTVRDGEGRETVSVSFEDVTRLELDHLHFVRKLPDDAPERPEEIDEPARPVHV